MKHRVAMHCCIKLTAHLCLRSLAHVLIYRKVHCLCNEYKNVNIHTWVFFVSGIKRAFKLYLNGLHRAVNAFGLSRSVFIKIFVILYVSCIMSALLSSLSPSQSHTLWQENVFKCQSMKNHIFCSLLFKELQILCEKWQNYFGLCAACTVPCSDWPIAVI